MFSFNLNDLPDSENELLAPGWYDVTIDDAEVKSSKNGGRYLKLRYKVFSENAPGRVTFDIINFENENEVAERIGKAALKKIMMATGLKQINGPGDFVLLSLSVKIDVQKGKDGYDDQNRAKDYRKITGSTSAPIVKQEQELPWG